MRINNNPIALTALNAFQRNNNAIDATIRHLSTGLRINSAADDAAGLAISENFRAQLKGIDRPFTTLRTEYHSFRRQKER